MEKRRVVRCLSYVFFAFFFFFFVSACSGPISSNDYHYIEGISLKRSSPSSLTLEDFRYDRSGRRKPIMPGQGEVPLLVIPVEFSDFPFSNNDLDSLLRAFGEKENNYWYSLKDYYKESSFNKLSLKPSIVDVYETKMTAGEFMSQTTTSSRRTLDLLREAVEFYRKNSESNLQEFDSNNDGFIDAVYLIYSSPDYRSIGNDDPYKDLTATQKEEFWAYTNWDYGSESDLNSPNPSAYCWLSISFLNDGSISGGDAHTLIHETGHLLGLPDYYNVDQGDASSRVDPLYRDYGPLGGLDMMDLNIGDHNAFSKMALGWLEPVVIDEDASFPLVVELKDSFVGREALVLESPYQSYNNPFSEYILVELYNPGFLNQLDAQTMYRGYYPKNFFMPGLKIYHVDARVRSYRNTLGSVIREEYLDPVDESVLNNDSRSNWHVLEMSNTPSESAAQNYRLLHLLESDGELTFNNLHYEEVGGPIYANNSTLFYPEDGKSTFESKKFKDFFANNDGNGNFLFNDGNQFPYTLRVNGIRGNLSEGYESSITIDVKESEL